MLDSHTVVIPYAPRELQERCHDTLDRYRYAVIVCHRRFGKTVMAVNHLIRAALTCQLPEPRYAYIAPTYAQGKAVAWDYLKKYAGVIPGVRFNESELRCDLPNGARVRLYGADSPDALRGIYLDGVVFDEFGLMDGRTYSEVIRPALADRKGWAAFLGTPAGRNAFWHKRNEALTDPDWALIEFKASQTGIIAEEELLAARRQMSDDEYRQEFECSFEASVKGAFYAEQMAAARDEGRITSVRYDRAMPVNTYWDLGVGDATAIWFVQGVGNELRLIDYCEASGEGIPYYVGVLKAKGYQYGEHWAPHDIEVREFSSGRSRLETARTLGINFRITPNIPFEDGIHAARLILDRCWFDEAKCQAGIDALTNYRRDFNSRIGEYKAVPVHDWASHGADAFRYLAVAWRDALKVRPIDRYRRNERRVTAWAA